MSQYEIVKTLQDNAGHWMSATDISEVTGYNIKNVRQKLARLRRYKLIVFKNITRPKHKFMYVAYID